MGVKESRENSSRVMTALLKSPIFHKLPSIDIQKITQNLDVIQVNKGATIIDQGGDGDYFYVINSGQCMCARKSSPTAKEIKLRTLTTGDIFGEDALITDAKRALTVTALTDVFLLRLSKQNFISLIKEPSLIFIDYKKMQEEIQLGSVLLDVRSSDAYQADHIGGSITIPFFLLRAKLSSLNPEKTLIVICDNGRVSEAAAFLLLNNKMTAKILKGGMAGITSHFGTELSSNQLESTSSYDFKQVFFQHFEPSVDDCCWQIEMEFGFQLGENCNKLNNERYVALLKYLRSIRSDIKQNYLLKVNDLFDIKYDKDIDGFGEQPVFSGISLISDNEMEEDSVVTAIISRCNQIFSEDLTRLSQQFGQNPISPENLVLALVAAITPLKLNADYRITLYRTFEVNVFSQLGFIYRKLLTPNS